MKNSANAQETDLKILEKKKIRQQKKQQGKKKLSDALRKNLLRRKNLDK